jgi:hypothetical protein
MGKTPIFSQNQAAQITDHHSKVVTMVFSITTFQLALNRFGCIFGISFPTSHTGEGISGLSVLFQTFREGSEASASDSGEMAKSC